MKTLIFLLREKQVFDTFPNIFYCSIEYELYFVDGYGEADEQANMTCSLIKYSTSRKLNDSKLTNHRP